VKRYVITLIVDAHPDDEMLRGCLSMGPSTYPYDSDHQDPRSRQEWADLIARSGLVNAAAIQTNPRSRS
jgi:hypothetical protein